MQLDEQTARLMNFAGFALAHGVGGVSSGDTLCTMALIQRQTEQGLTQFPGPIGESVAQAKSTLSGMDDLLRCAIVYDAVVMVEGAESTAVVVEASWKDHLDQPTVALQRYRSAGGGEGFAVVGEPLFATAETDQEEVLLREALMEGARSHDEAFAVWMKATED